MSDKESVINQLENIIPKNYDPQEPCDPADILEAVQVRANHAIKIIKESVNDFRMDELDAVMTSVDKWLVGDALKNNPATRAADAREVALNAIEAEAARANRAEAELAALTFIPSGREYEIACSYAACDWGQGLGGMGRCSGHGNPRDPHCPKFTTEAADYNPEAGAKV